MEAPSNRPTSIKDEEHVEVGSVLGRSKGFDLGCSIDLAQIEVHHEWRCRAKSRDRETPETNFCILHLVVSVPVSFAEGESTRTPAGADRMRHWNGEMFPRADAPCKIKSVTALSTVWKELGWSLNCARPIRE
jgi:hypothetical protein